MKDVLFVLALLIFAEHAAATTFAGNYGGVTEDGPVSIQLTEENGRVQGTLTLDGYPLAIVGTVQGDEMTGQLQDEDDEVYRFQARIFAGRLNIEFEDGDQLSLGPIEGQTPYTDPLGGANAQTDQAPTGISINGQVLTVEHVQQLNQNGIQLQPADYWYDPVCGAWGIWGGPTAGFVQAGMPVPPLPAHASNGNTGVFINGRIIAMNELLYLQQLAQGPIAPGQYWLDAYGNAGPVGGMAVINFLQAAQRSSGDGGSNSSWYGNGSSGWSSSDGSGGVWIANPYGGTGTTVTY